MTPLEIRLGTRLELELLNNRGEKYGSTYVSQLLEKQEDGCLVISAPIFEARLIYIPLNMQIRLYLLHPDLGPLGFSAVVESRGHLGNIAVLVVRPSGELEKIQRRSHYRLDHVANALIRINDGNDKDGGRAPIKATTKNISGSGLCVLTDIDIPVKTELEIELNVTDSLIIKAKCLVVRNTTVEIKNSKSHELGLYFTEISQKDQDSIIKFVFEQQRIRLKKELK